MENIAWVLPKVLSYTGTMTREKRVVLGFQTYLTFSENKS